MFGEGSSDSRPCSRWLLMRAR